MTRTRILPVKRLKRKRTLLIAFVFVTLQAPAQAGLNEPRPTLLYPGVNDERKSQDVPIVFARFDRPLASAKFELLDASMTQVPGIVRLNEPDDEHESYRVVEFIPVDPLSEGVSPYTANTVVCPWPVGDCASQSWTFAIDDTAPSAPSIASPINNSLVTTHVVTVRGIAEAGSTVSIFEVPDFQHAIARGVADETGNYTIQLPYPPEDGVEHRIRVAATDRAGNTSPLSGQRRFIHDSIHFLPIITSPVEGSHHNVATLPVEGRAKANSTAKVYEGATLLVTTPVGADERFGAPVTFAHGSHTITAIADDGLLIDGPSPAVTFVVDLVAPAAPVVTMPLAGSSVGGPHVVVMGTGEPLARVRLRDAGSLIAEGEIPGNGAWSVTITRPDGPVALTAEVVDRAGNVSPQTPNPFTVDSVPPGRPAFTSPPDGAWYSSGALVFGGIAEANATVAIFQSGTQIGTTTATGAGTFSIPLVFSDGVHTIFAFAIDAAGNISERSEPLTFGVDTIAPLPPTIGQPFPGDTYTQVPIVVSGEGEPSSGITVYEGVTPLGTTSATTEGAWTLEVTVPIGAQTIHATSTDRASNVSAPGPAVTFTYDPGPPDVTPPPIPLIVEPQTGAYVEPVVIFAGTAEAFARVEIRQGATVIATANADEAGEWATSRLMTAGTKSVTARAIDRSGNIGSPSPLRTFVVDAKRPTIEVTSGIPLAGYTIQFVFGSTTDVLAGTAEDDVLVDRIELEAVNRVTNQRYGVFEAICLSCPGQAVTWTATVEVPLGVYWLEAYAVDRAGRRSLPAIHLMLRV